MDFYYKPTGQVVNKFEVQAITGYNTELACLENLQEAGVYPLVDEVTEGFLDNTEVVFEEEGGVFYRRNSTAPIDTSIAKLKATLHLSKYAESEVTRLLENSGLSPSTVAILLLLRSKDQDNRIPGIDIETIENMAIHVLQTLHDIEKAESTEEIKQLLKETVPS